jgi:hypothetical protein
LKKHGILKTNIWPLLSNVGIVIFILMYLIAASLYPGGSQVDKNSIGFSWLHNYWCNLLNEQGMNGQYNPGQPVAILAMCILCWSISICWYMFPKKMTHNKTIQIATQTSGILSMISALFLFSAINHDLVTSISAIFGFIAIAGLFIILYRKKNRALFFFGLWNLILIALNNFVYYNEGYIIYLPVIQKISFVSILGWIGWLNLVVYRTERVKKN